MKFGLGTSTEKNGIPRIESVTPAAAIPGGEVEIRGSGFATRANLRPVVRFGEAEATLSLASSAPPGGASAGRRKRRRGARGDAGAREPAISRFRGHADCRQSASSGESGGGFRRKYLM